jgi:hypothetical protein
MMTTYLDVEGRALSPMEQTFCIADEICSFNFTMHCELSGELAEEGLRMALDKVQARHPLLRMHLDGEVGEVRFLPGTGPIPLRIAERPVSALVAECEHELHTRFDGRQGPMVRCVLMRHGPAHATLLVTFHHLIGDGISGSLLLRDLFRAWRGEDLVILPLAESADRHLPATARGFQGFTRLVSLLGQRLGRTLSHGGIRYLPVERPASYGERQAAVRMLRFEPKLVSVLADRARREHTTVHGALSAAILMASRPELGPLPAHVAFSSALNMRDRFSPAIGDDLGLFATLVYSAHLVDDKTGFWPLARELKAGLNEAVDSGQPFLGITALPRWIMYRFRKAGRGEPGKQAVTTAFHRGMVKAFALTNIGKVNIVAENGPIRISALGFVASPSVLAASAFTAATIGGTLCLNSIVMEPVVSRGTQDRILERVQSLIRSAIDWRSE